MVRATQWKARRSGAEALPTSVARPFGRRALDDAALRAALRDWPSRSA
ncbi:hypothetical protein [Streptomyces sp. NPDC053367]